MDCREKLREKKRKIDCFGELIDGSWKGIMMMNDGGYNGIA